jgi:hypothetical protein
MADTPNKGLARPAAGSTTWNVPLNNNASLIDAALGNSSAIAVNAIVSTSPVALTAPQYQCMALEMSGLQSVNVNIQVPAGVAGQWVIINNATGSYTLTMSHGSGGATVDVPQGSIRSIYADGTANGIVVADTQHADPGALGQVAVYGALTNAGGSNALTFNAVTGLDIVATDAVGNVVQNGLTVEARTSATPAVGIGTSIKLKSQTGVSTYTDALSLAAYSTDIAAGTEDFDLLLKLMRGGTLSEALKLTGVGVLTINGSYTVIASGRSTAQSLTTTGITATAENSGTISSGTYKPDPANGNFKTLVNGGAFTLAAPDVAGDYTMILQITNGVSAGTVTLSGFTKTQGSSLTTTNGDDFLIYITKVNGFTYSSIVSLQ